MFIARPLFLVGWMLLLLSCGNDPSFSEGSSHQQKVIYWPSSDIESQSDGVVESFDMEGRTFVASDSPTNKVWLNFEGASLASTDSSVLRNRQIDQVTIPRFELADMGAAYANQERDDLINDILVSLVDRFQDIDVAFSLKEPEPPYQTLHIGGENFTGIDGAIGISPLDIGNFSDSDILYVFSGEYANESSDEIHEIVVNAISHELGHSYGTRHIENQFAIMNPFLNQESRDFDQSGPYPGESVEENSKRVLLQNMGIGQSRLLELPQIQDLDVQTQDDIGQYSPFHLTNVRENPDQDLADFEYAWTYDGEQLEGYAVRIQFEDFEAHDLILELSHPSIEDTREFHFRVGRFEK